MSEYISESADLPKYRVPNKSTHSTCVQLHKSILRTLAILTGGLGTIHILSLYLAQHYKFTDPQFNPTYNLLYI